MSFDDKPIKLIEYIAPNGPSRCLAVVTSGPDDETPWPEVRADRIETTIDQFGEPLFFSVYVAGKLSRRISAKLPLILHY